MHIKSKFTFLPFFVVVPVSESKVPFRNAFDFNSRLAFPSVGRLSVMLEGVGIPEPSFPINPGRKREKSRDLAPKRTPDTTQMWSSSRKRSRSLTVNS
ncbi:hypothetical protein JTE90_006049 [Oedothorax gibbosus]|uniref:Secreted protein n=1 Tax=Oedothorax gibbosus TaxID=931172 RepID=A0AAV6V6J8_9ARAC|nr:hypothetical protein JTE90_006049 [Oedothorax gibbosus]